MQIQLIHKDGHLYTPLSVITDPLLRRHYSGDPILVVLDDDHGGETIHWPDYNPTHLRAALYGDRETGVIPKDTEVVLLPNGQEFVIDL